MTATYDLSVLHVSAARYQPGSARHATFAIWRELAVGFRRYTIAARSSSGKSARFLADGVDVHLLPSVLSSEAEFLASQFGVLGVATACAPDVIVAQCPIKGGLAGATYAARRPARLLCEIHGNEYFVDAAFGTKASVIQFLSGPALARADRIRALTPRMRDQIIARYGNHLADRIVVLPPRVDLSTFSTIKTSWQISHRPVIAIVGAINENKGQVRLLKDLLGTPLDAELWIIGSGPDEAACKSLIESHCAKVHCRFFGQLSHSELAKLLPQVDIYVQYSNSEGTPRAILEAMAVGLPVVTTDAGFCRDIVEHNETGIVLGTNPSAEIVNVLRRLFADEELRAHFGQMAHARIESVYDASKLYPRYRALIAETAAL